jgi:hypothetical protein
LKGRASGPSATLPQMWSLASLLSSTALTVVMDWTKSWRQPHDLCGTCGTA